LPGGAYTGWAKNGLFWGDDNFAMVNGRKACDMSKVAEFCPELPQKLHVDAFKYSLPSLHKYSQCLKLW